MLVGKRPVWRGKIDGVEHAIVSQGGDVLEAWPSHLGGSAPTIRSESPDCDPDAASSTDARVAFIAARTALGHIRDEMWEPTSATVEFGGLPWVLSTRESLVWVAFRGHIHVQGLRTGVRVYSYDPSDVATLGVAAAAVGTLPASRFFPALAALCGKVPMVPPDLAAELIWRWHCGA